MKHAKDNCSAHHMIIANNCGLACANCGVCKCEGKSESKEEHINQLKLLKEALRLEWQRFHDSNPFTSYSSPVWQYKAIDKEIKKLSA